MWSSLRMLIWDRDTGCYEKSRISEADDLPMWNMDMASLAVCARAESVEAKDMYAQTDGQWQKIKRQERVYSETEFYDIPGEGEYPYPDGYRELIYSDGEPVEKQKTSFPVS